MVVPNLIHPIPILIERVDKADTLYDRDLREPIRSVSRQTILVSAQVRYRQASDPRWEAMGVSEEVRGYLLFRVLDLALAGYVPKLGDRIVKVGHRVTELYLLQSQDVGHYPDQDGATLERHFFTDRRPATRAPSM